MVHSPYYDGEYDGYMKVNPPKDPEKDLDPFTGELYEYNGLDSVSLMNWNDDEGLTFHPRVRERNDWIDGGRARSLDKGLRAASEDEAPELDWEYDCE